MFGELALSERAIADQGILAFGSATADANFTVDGAPMFIASASEEMSAIGVKVSIGVGVLAGIFEASASFLQGTELTRFGTVISDMRFQHCANCEWYVCSFSHIRSRRCLYTKHKLGYDPKCSLRAKR
jgi:hypothetical protein